MFDSLCHLLGFKKGENIPNKFYLVKDCLSNPGDFVLANAMSTILHSKAPILFVAIDKPYSHYLHVMKKLGHDLDQCQQNGLLTFVDTTKPDWGKVCERENEPFESSEEHLKALYTLCQQKATANGVHIMIDDMSYLLATSTNRALLATFLNYTRQMTIGSKENPTSLHVLVHQDMYEEQTVSLEHEADVVVRVNGLESGATKEVHGEICVRVPDDDKTAQPWKWLAPMHYRCTDVNVHVFKCGTIGI